MLQEEERDIYIHTYIYMFQFWQHISFDQTHHCSKRGAKIEADIKEKAEFSDKIQGTAFPFPLQHLCGGSVVSPGPAPITGCTTV